MLPALFGVLAVLTLLYQFGLDSLTDSLQSSALGIRVLVTIVVLARSASASACSCPSGCEW